jgi:DHA1 family tetracycline resistance protein-like MFS transporter
MNKPSLGVIFLTVLLDLVGFGLVLPLLPIFSQTYGASPLMVGVIMASYSVMQFLFSPIWGRLSDRVGRRPVLLASTACASLSYAVFALGTGLEGRAALAVFLISRLLAGVCGASITVAQAYVADISPPEQRTRRMGLIGMAFGLGFILGPGLGAGAVSWYGYAGPGWFACALCAINFVVAFIWLRESWTPRAEHAPERPRLTVWTEVLRRPGLGLLVFVYFLATFAFTCFETTLGLLISRNFNLHVENPHDDRMIACLFAYCGVVGALVQGGFVGRLAKRMGEPALIGVSLLLFAAALAPLPFVTTRGPLLVVLAVLAIGSSLTRPPVFGLLSQWTSARDQGTTLGVAQSAGSLARILGPLTAGALYQIQPAAPYVVCALLALVTALWAWPALQRVRPAPES